LGVPKERRRDPVLCSAFILVEATGGADNEEREPDALYLWHSTSSEVAVREHRIAIRPFCGGDEVLLAELFARSVASLAPLRYTEAQTRAWLSNGPDAVAMKAQMQNREGFVAERRGKVVGWIDLLSDGRIDMFYCSPEVAKSGVADQLYATLLERARHLQLGCLLTEASLFAESFFLRHGWRVDEREVIEREGIKIARARMSLMLLRSAEDQTR
jgi:putative acetyltransferase